MLISALRSSQLPVRKTDGFVGASAEPGGLRVGKLALATAAANGPFVTSQRVKCQNLLPNNAFITLFQNKGMKTKKVFKLHSTTAKLKR